MLFFSEEVLCVQPLAKHFAIIIVITARKKSETKNYCWAKNITGNSREITTVEIECSKSQIFSRKPNFENEIHDQSGHAYEIHQVHVANKKGPFRPHWSPEKPDLE